MTKSNDKKISTKEIENFLLDEDVRLCMDWGKERNPFEIIEPDEVRNSRMLAWLLNPREGHLQGDYFIKALIRTVLETYKDTENINLLKKNPFFKDWKVFDVEQTSFANAVVWPEFQISESQAGKKRVDITMFDKANELFLFIENKFGSPEGKDQTTEYFKGLEKLLKPLNPKDPPYRLYIFLDYNENKAKSKDWISLNYNWLQNALKQLIDRDAIPAGVEYVLKGYYEYLSNDNSSNPYHSGPEKHLAAIARKHQNLLKFMRKLKNELAKQTTERLLLDEPKKIEDKLYLLYWQHPSFFWGLFDYTGWEYIGEKLERKIGDKGFEYVVSKRAVYIHNTDWKKYYKRDYTDWGIQPYVLQESNGDTFLFLGFWHEQFEEKYAERIGGLAKAVGGEMRLGNWVTSIKQKISANANNDDIVNELVSMYKKIKKHIGCLDNK
jgi:hypothetical protein